MDIRTRWIHTTDADKCQYNGYADFVKKEQGKMNREEKEKELNIKSIKDLRKRKLNSRK